VAAGVPFIRPQKTLTVSPGPNPVADTVTVFPGWPAALPTMEALAAPAGETSCAVAALLLPCSCATTVAPEPLDEDGMVNWVNSEPVLLIFPMATSVPGPERLATSRTTTVEPGSKPLPWTLT
jgi:hypothetical protein